MKMLATIAALAILAVASAAPAQAQNPTLAATPNLQLLTAGTVNAVVRLSDGSVVIGGSFVSVAGTPRRNLAKLKADGTLDANWNPSPNGTVTAIVRDGLDNLYVGGTFSSFGANQVSIGGQVRDYLAKLSPTGSGAADAAWNPAPGSQISALAFDGIDALIVGGSFSTIGGQSHSRLAKVSASAGTADASWNPASASGSVYALAIDGTSVFVGGNFASIGGQSFAGLAKLGISGAGSADAAWNPAPDQPVAALAADGLGNVYVGGYFSSIGGQTRQYLAKLSGSGSGAADASWNPAPNSLVKSLFVDNANATVFAGGYFTTIGGQSRSNLAKLASTGGGSADSTWNVSTDGGVLALAGGGGKLHAGGTFVNAGGQLRLAYAAASASGGGTLAAAADAGSPGSINAMVRQADGGIVVGGAFSKADALPRGNLLRLKPDGTLDAAWNPSADNVVKALALDTSGNLFAGGFFAQVGGLARVRLVKLSAAGAVDANWAPSVTSNPFSGYINALATDTAGNVYAGGSFTMIGATSRTNLARIPGTGSGVADANWAPNPDNSVFALATDAGGNVFVGGSFSNIGGGSHFHLAKLSAAGSGAADPAWTIAGAYTSALLVAAGQLYVGNGSSPYLRKIAIATGVADATWNPNPDYSVTTLAIDGSGAIFVGGSFDHVGGLLREGIAKVSPSGTVDANWDAQLLDGTPRALIANGGAIYAGGDFKTIAGGSRLGLARLTGDSIFANGFE
jgi:hypothetical protein